MEYANAWNQSGAGLVTQWAYFIKH